MSAEVAEECVESGGGGSRGHHSTLLVEWGGALGRPAGSPAGGAACPAVGIARLQEELEPLLRALQPWTLF